MDRLISAPVLSASKRAIRNATQKVCQVFESFAEYTFFSFSFLDREDRWEHVLHEVCILHSSPNGLPVLPFWSWFHNATLKTCCQIMFNSVSRETSSRNEFFTAEEFRLFACNEYAKFIEGQSIVGQSQMISAELVQDFERMSLRYSIAT